MATEIDSIPQTKSKPAPALDMASGSPLLALMAEVEAAHFRTVEDTGAHGCALLIWNALRRRAGLPWLAKENLPAWDGKAYTMPADSTLLANRLFEGVLLLEKQKKNERL